MDNLAKAIFIVICLVIVVASNSLINHDKAAQCKANGGTFYLNTTHAERSFCKISRDNF